MNTNNNNSGNNHTEQISLAFLKFKNTLKKLKVEQKEILSKFIKNLEQEKIEVLRNKLNN